MMRGLGATGTSSPHLKDYIRVNEIPPVSPHSLDRMRSIAHEPTSLVARAEPKLGFAKESQHDMLCTPCFAWRAVVELS